MTKDRLKFAKFIPDLKLIDEVFYKIEEIINEYKETERLNKQNENDSISK